MIIIKLYTGGCGVIVYNKYHTRILLGKRTDGAGWCIAGGKREDNETPSETARRELKEEFGLDVSIENMKYLGKIYSKTIIKGEYTNVISNIFYTDKFNGNITPQESEIEEIRWCDFYDILDLDNIYIPSLNSINRFVYPEWDKNIL